MKKASITVIVLLFILTIGTVLFAETTQTEKPSREYKRFIGTVVEADNVTKTLVLKTWTNREAFDAASARIAGHENFQDMEPGERVLVRYFEEDGKKVATWIAKAARKPEVGRK